MLIANYLPIQVVLYVDGIRVGTVSATSDTPHHIIHRLCEIDMDMAANLQQPGQQQQGVGFTLKLPELQHGRHEVRAFLDRIGSCTALQKEHH